MVFNLKFSSNSSNQKKWDYPGTTNKKSHNIYHYLQMRECGLLSKNSNNNNNNNNNNNIKINIQKVNEFTHSITNIASKYIPGSFSEYELPLSGNDKIFASKWLSDQYIIFGTKNSRLILYNTKTGLQVGIPCQPKELLNQRKLNNVVHKIMNNSWSNSSNNNNIPRNIFSTQTNFGFNSYGNYNYNIINGSNQYSPLYSSSTERNLSLPNLSNLTDVSMSTVTMSSSGTIANSMQFPLSPISNSTNSSSDTYINNTQSDSLMMENEIIITDNNNNNNIENENHSIISSSSNSDDPSSSNQYLTSDTATSTTTSSSNNQSSPTVLFPCSGIHSIAVNQSNTLLAIGSNKPFEIILYKLPTLYPIAILTGHNDLVFSVEFIDDYTVISGSRDMNISIWNVKQIVLECERELAESNKETYMDIDDYYDSSSNDYFNNERDDENIFETNDTEDSNNNYSRPITLNKSTRSQYNDFMSKISIPSLPKVSAFNYSPSPVHYKINTIFGTPLYITTPTTIRKEHRDKVRDLKFNKYTKQFLSLSSDQCVKLWDAKTLDVIKTMYLKREKETVCIGLESENNIYAIGSQLNISIIDPRTTTVAHKIESLDDGWGVRALTFKYYNLAIGGGYGRLAFYDLRNQKYHEWETSAVTSSDGLNSIPLHSLNPTLALNENEFNDVGFGGLNENKYHQNSIKTQYYQTGKGWMLKDNIYTTHFHGIDVKQAIYSLEYSPNQRCLFAGGGPIQISLKGIYGALWM
ncbi:WD40 repeat-like protein [Neocallimastix californiae]|uniref:WD40 repeat-like protein n=1 Tax=Neocallimastix californiae TaxID=1754190 RepID=A0A1Y2F2A5_9FUNG|nr:WD40 repeat-like protein [Neocallimastix californiae]|eukprot:ORY77837.1 WD40 repeat-like protein [Neocallimastix californiae]